MKLTLRMAFSIVLCITIAIWPAAVLGAPNYNQEIRIVDDIPKIASILSNSKGEVLLPALIVSDGLANRPGGPPGFFASGTLTLLDWRDKDKVIKKLPYSVLISSFPRNSQEEGKRYSPYIMGGGMAICVKSDQFNQGNLIQFPKTYVISEAWYADIAKSIVSPSPKTNAETPLGISLSASSLIKNGITPDLLYKHLAKGDSYSKALIIAMFFHQTFLKDPGAANEMVTFINSNPPVESGYGIALGVVTAISNGSIPEKDVPILLESLSNYCKRNGASANAANDIVQWILSFK